MRSLSNVEIVLLELIHEYGEISGYEIDRLVEERGYRKWADIGTTSIYVGLEKLRKKSIVEFYIDTRKQGKGPLPKKFKLTKRGESVLKNEIVSALSSSREKEKRFDLALAGIPMLTREEAIAALQKRKEFLLGAAKNIHDQFQSEGGENLALHTKALFKHPMFLIKHEIDFADSLIAELRQAGE